jgi:hypothetical protein
MSSSMSEARSKGVSFPLLRGLGVVAFICLACAAAAAAAVLGSILALAVGHLVVGVRPVTVVRSTAAGRLIFKPN